MAGTKKAVRRVVGQNDIARAKGATTYVQLTKTEATTLAGATSGDLATALTASVAKITREVPHAVVVLRIK
jgi:hypothetical protein